MNLPIWRVPLFPNKRGMNATWFDVHILGPTAVFLRATDMLRFGGSDRYHHQNYESFEEWVSLIAPDADIFICLAGIRDEVLQRVTSSLESLAATQFADWFYLPAQAAQEEWVEATIYAIPAVGAETVSHNQFIEAMSHALQYLYGLDETSFPLVWAKGLLMPDQVSTLRAELEERLQASLVLETVSDGNITLRARFKDTYCVLTWCPNPLARSALPFRSMPDLVPEPLRGAYAYVRERLNYLYSYKEGSVRSVWFAQPVRGGSGPDDGIVFVVFEYTDEEAA